MNCFFLPPDCHIDVMDVSGSQIIDATHLTSITKQRRDSTGRAFGAPIVNTAQYIGMTIINLIRYYD